MKNVCVIGLGVGMAHVCALVRRGDNVVALIDTNSERLDAAELEWKNEWGGFIERVPINPRCHYTKSFGNLPVSLKVDLVIVCVPPNAQSSVYAELKQWYLGDILLEKPLMINHQDLDSRTYVSCEWINHTGLGNINEISDIRMAYPVGPELWKQRFSAEDDLSSHLFSILLKKGVRVSKIGPISRSHDISIFMMDTNIGMINCVVSRMPPYGLQVNGIQMDWEEDLFDKYYDDMILAKDLKSIMNLI